MYTNNQNGYDPSRSLYPGLQSNPNVSPQNQMTNSNYSNNLSSGNSNYSNNVSMQNNPNTGINYSLYSNTSNTSSNFPRSNPPRDTNISPTRSDVSVGNQSSRQTVKYRLLNQSVVELLDTSFEEKIIREIENVRRASLIDQYNYSDGSLGASSMKDSSKSNYSNTNDENTNENVAKKPFASKNSSFQPTPFTMSKMNMEKSKNQQNGNNHIQKNDNSSDYKTYDNSINGMKYEEAKIYKSAIEIGFKESVARFAISAYGSDSLKVMDCATKYQDLMAMGHNEEDVKRVLLLTDREMNKCLEMLSSGVLSPTVSNPNVNWS